MNVDPVIALVVGEKLATLYELKTVYTLDDLYDMAEIITVQNFNEWYASKEASKPQGRK